MKRNKHQFHCEKCASACEIYRKGKKHRVLICPSCGVLATNPKSFLGTVFGSGIKAQGDQLKAGLSMVGIGGKEKGDSAKAGKTTYDSLDKPNKGERYVNIALGR